MVKGRSRPRLCRPSLSLARSRSVAAAWRLLLLVQIGAFAIASVAEANEPSTLAIAGFDFQDTSGETPDRTAEHAARLQAFEATLRDRLAEDTKIDPVPLDCGTDPCTLATPGLDILAAQAKAAGRRYLLFGTIHKMSTLVGWVQFAVLDLIADKSLCERRLTYRGDNDEAWQRAAKFVARDVDRHCLGKSP